MRRRDFILSCALMAGGSIFVNRWVPFKLTASFANSVQTLLEESPVPEILHNVTTIIHGEAFLLENGAHERIILEGVGGIIWSHIDGKKTCKQIADVLSEEFDIDDGRALKDVKEFVFQLEAEGFIRISKVVQCYAVEKVVCKKRIVKSQ
jgi:hypothetical protein